MNWTVIILAIIVIILVYVLYSYIVKKSNVLSKSANLNGSNPAITTISSGNSVQYAYGIWVYVNTWSTDVSKNIFSRPGNISLDLATDTPTLTCTVTTTTNPSPVVLTITNNFPIQTWVYVVISSDGSVMDFYLNGKLVNSTQVQSPAQPASSSAITYGSGWDCYVAGFRNWATPIGPQEVWDSYLKGHGNPVAQFFSQYGLDISVTKDNIVQKTYKL